MKNVSNRAAAIALALALPTAQLFAKGKTFTVLSDSAWQEIEQSTETDYLQEIEAIPALNIGRQKLSDVAWQEIELHAEMDNLEEIEAIPALNFNKQNTLDVDFKPGNFSNLRLDAPFNQSEQVGIVVLDAQGEMVHSAAGKYGDLKDLHFIDYYNFDMTYVVKVYSETEVYEAKVQVVYR